MGCRTLGSPGAQGRVPATLCIPPTFVSSAAFPSELLPQFHLGVGSRCFCGRLADEGYHRTGILGTWLLQPLFCYSKGHGQLAACDRSFSPQPLRQSRIFVWKPPCRSSNLCALGIGWCPSTFRMRTSRFLYIWISSVLEVLFRSTNIPISGSLFWSFIRSVCVHPCHGPGLLHYASLWLSDPPLPRRLARPRIIFSGDSAGERLPLVAVSRVRDSRESLQELCHSCSISRLAGYDSTLKPFEGFPDPNADPEGALSRRRVLLLSAAINHSRLGALSSASCPQCPLSFPDPVSE